MINRIIHGCLQIWNFSSRVQLDTKKLQQFIFSCFISYSFADLTLEIASWTLEEKFHINANQCIILYLLNEDEMAEFAIQPQCKIPEFQRISMRVARSLSDWFSNSPAIIDCWPQKRLLIEWFSKRTGTSFQNGARSKNAEKKLGRERRRVVLKSDLAVVSTNRPRYICSFVSFLNILTLAL